MKNIKDLRTEMVNVFDKVKAGKMETKTAKELNNSAGKIISSCKVELEYKTYKNATPRIPFLETT